MSRIQGWNLLHVEDNPADAHLLLSLLRDADFSEKVHWVKDGEEALRFLDRELEYADAPAPNAILLDLALPKVNGLEVLSTVRQREDLKHAPVIVFSTSKSPRDITACHALGVHAFLTKPSDLSDFEKLVARLVSIEFPRLGWTHPRNGFSQKT